MDPDTSIQEVVDKYVTEVELDLAASTVRTYTQGISKFIKFARSHDILPSHPIQNLCAGLQMFEKFPHWLSTNKFPKATRKVYISAVTSFLDWLVIRGYATPTAQELARYKNAIRLSNRKRESRLPKFAPEGTIEKLLHVMDTRDAKSPIRERDIAIVQLLFTSGCRVAELAALNVENIDLENLQAVVIGKGDKEAFIYFNDKTRYAIEAYWHARNSDEPQGPAFSRHDNAAAGLRDKNRITTAGIRYIINRAAKDGGIDPMKISPHSFRHAFAIRILKATGRIEITQELMRHSSVDTTRIYATVANQELRQAHRLAFLDEENKEEK